MSLEFAEFLLEAGVLRLGEFTLKSGRVSPYFLDFGRARTGRSLARLGAFFADRIFESVGPVDLVYGPAYKGIPLAVAACEKLWERHGVECAYTSLRKEAKAHGEGGLFLGAVPAGGERVVLVDDVMTTGGTKVEAIESMKRYLADHGAAPAQLVAVVVGVDRQETDASGRPAAAAFEEETGIPVVSIATVRGLFEALADRVGEADRRRVEEYLAR